MAEFNITAELLSLREQVKTLQSSGDTRWAMLTGSNTFMMLVGFTLLEAGSLKAINLNGVMLKQFAVVVVTGLVWYLWGHGVAFGVSSTEPNSFIGTAYAALHDVRHDNPAVYVEWWFQFCFAAVGCSILSGSIGERVRFPIYLNFLWLLAGWIYPIVVYAQWSTNGWNSPFNDGSRTGKISDEPYTGVIDAAGGGPVHMVGGICAFVAAWLAGPRIGRFDPVTKAANSMPGHNSAFVTVGVMLLWFGWFSFNCGGKINDQTNQHLVVGRSNMNTMIASSASGFLILFIRSARTAFEEWDLVGSLNGVLAGLVAITSCSTVVDPWAAFVIGVVASIVYIFMVWLITDVMHVDDPVEATAVHFGSGMLGLLCTGLLAEPHAVRIAYGKNISDDYAGAFMGGNGKLLGFQLVSIVFIFVWTFAHAFAYFWVMDKWMGLRYSKEIEERGVDYKQGYDYISPLMKVGELTKNLSALRGMLMDGNPSAAEDADGAEMKSLSGSMRGTSTTSSSTAQGDNKNEPDASSAAPVFVPAASASAGASAGGNGAAEEDVSFG